MAVRLDSAPGRLRLLVEEPSREDDPDRYIAGLEAVGAHEEPFALLISIAIPLELPHEFRKAQNLWFKATRQRMDALCRACAIVRLEPTDEMQKTFQGLWHFPVKVTGSLDEAEAFLAAHDGPVVNADGDGSR
jgi:hypothetical protein